MNACTFRLRDLIHQNGRKQRIELEAWRPAIASAAIRPALFTDLDEIGVNSRREAGGAHVAQAAFHVPNEN
jgi:hypothetical protein